MSPREWFPSVRRSVRGRGVEEMIVANVNVCSYVNGGRSRIGSSLFRKHSNVNVSPTHGRVKCFSTLAKLIRHPSLGGLLSHGGQRDLTRRKRCTCVTALRTFHRTRVSRRFLLSRRMNVLCKGSDDTTPMVRTVSIVHTGGGATVMNSNSVFRSVGSAVAVGLSIVFRLGKVGFAVSKTYTDNSRTVNVTCVLVGSKLRSYVLYKKTRRMGPCSINDFSKLNTFSAHRSRPRGTSHPFSGKQSNLMPDKKNTDLMLRDCRSTMEHKTAVLTRIVKCNFSSGKSRVSMPGISNPEHSLRVTVGSTNVPLRRVRCVGTRTASAPIKSLGRTGTVTRIFKGRQPCIASAGSRAKRRV